MTTIEQLTTENAALKEGLEGWHSRCLDAEVERDALAQNAERVRVYKQRYFEAIAERDELREGLDGWHARYLDAEADAERYRKLCAILQKAYDTDSFESERLTIYCEQLSGWRNERTVEATLRWLDARDAGLDLSSAIDAAIAGEKHD